MPNSIAPNHPPEETLSPGADYAGADADGGPGTQAGTGGVTLRHHVRPRRSWKMSPSAALCLPGFALQPWASAPTILAPLFTPLLPQRCPARPPRKSRHHFQAPMLSERGASGSRHALPSSPYSYSPLPVSV